MGRKSALSDKQWEKIGQRLLAGESTSQLAREYGVSKSTISGRFSERTKRVQAAAGLIVQAESAMGKLTVSERISARSLADELGDISSHLASAGKFGAATAHRLSALAHEQVQKIDDADPLKGESLQAMRGLSLMTKLANDSSTIGINLLAANKDMIKQRRDGDDPSDMLSRVLERLPS